MSPEEKAQEVWQAFEDNQSFIALVAQAIREAVLEEREACAKAVEFMLSDHCANRSEGRAYELAIDRIRARSKP